MVWAFAQPGTAVPRHIYAWYVTEVADPVGSHTEYSYALDGGVVYLESIEYDKRLPRNGYPRVDFAWTEVSSCSSVEVCHDDYPVSYIKGWRCPARCFVPVGMRVYITAEATDLDSAGWGMARL